MLPKITNAMLIVTHACNLACRYCFVHQEPTSMTEQTALDAVRFLINNCGEKETPNINFFGGEPMTMWDEVIVPVADWIRLKYNKPFVLGITTNGTLLDHERIRYMKERNFSLLLSIDGDRETQDYNRPRHDGSGSFESIEKNIPEILHAWPNVTFRSTIIPETAGNLYKNYLFAKNAGFRNMFVVPNVYESWSDEAWSTLETEMRKISDRIIRDCRNFEPSMTLNPVMKAMKDVDLIRSGTAGRRTMERCSASGKCGLGASRFASIHPNGNVYGCQEMTSNEGEESPFYIGNIYTGVSEARRYTLMGRYDCRSLRGDDCEHCPYDGVCDGGCVANNYLVTGDINRQPDFQCRWMRLLYDEAVYVTGELGDNKQIMSLKREVK